VRALVGCRVERERGLAGVHADLALLGDKLPGENVGDGGVELDLDALRVGRRGEAILGVCVGVARGAVGTDRLAAPAGGLADLGSLGPMTGWKEKGPRTAGLPSCRVGRSHMPE
jgi:hypothetical protein